MSETRPLGGKVATKPFLVLSAFALIGAVIVLVRYVFGIGSVTHMSDGYPWGVWITYDVVVGTAFACGGYAMALLVYVANKWQYHSLVRSALLASMFGYTLAGISVLIDVGRYWQAYNLFLPWYSHVDSIMFEVAFCITLYIVVLWIEFAPTMFEGYQGAVSPLIEKYKRFAPSFLQKIDPSRAKSRLNKVLFIFIAIGVLLPTMHQSSLGSLMIIAGEKLSPLWQTNFIPLLFLISAVTMGFSIIIFESVLSSYGFKRAMETPVLSRISGLIPWLLAIYLSIRFGDLIVRGQLGLAFRGDLSGNAFLVENLLYVIPLILLAIPACRTSPRWLFIASASMLLAGSVYRFNAFLVGFNPGPGWRYFPAFSEIMVTLGIISFEIMLYLMFVKKLPVLPKAEQA